MPTVKTKQLIQWAIALIVSFSILLIPNTENFTPELQKYFVITILAIFLFAFELIDSTIVAISLPVLYILFKLSDVQTVLGSSWANTSLWLMLGAMILGNCLDKTGFMKRMCYWLLMKAKGSFTKLIWFYFIAGVIANYAISAGGIVLFCLLSFGLIKSLGFKRDSNESALLMLMAYFCGNSLPVCLSYGTQIDMYMNIGRKIIPDLSLGWLEYAFFNIAFLPYMIICIWVMYKFILKPTTKSFEMSLIREEYEKLGKITTDEKKAVGIVILALLCLIFNAKIGIAVAWVFMLAALLCFLPGINIGDRKCINDVNFSFLFFMGGCLAIDTVGLNLGVANLVKPFLASIMGGGAFKASGALWILCFILNKIMTPLAAGAAFCPIVTQMCVEFGFNPVPLFLVMCNCFDNVLFPYESAPALQVYSFGMCTMGRFIKMMGTKSLINFIYILVVIVPYWTLLGLF